MCIKVPGGGNIICMNRGTFGFFNLMAKVVVSFLPFSYNNKNEFIDFSNDLELIKENFNKNKIGLSRFQDVLFNYILTKDPHNAEAFLIHPIQLEFSTFLRDFGEFFIIAHEYSHLLLKHLETSPSMKLKLFNNKFEVDLSVNSWKTELEADILGTAFALKYGTYQQQFHPVLSFLGVDFAFLCIDIIENALEVEVGKTHPPALVRRNFVKDYYFNNIIKGKNAKDAIDKSEKVFEYILYSCLKRSNSKLKELLKK